MFVWLKLEGSRLSNENSTARVKSNIIAAYAAIHKLGVVHGDIRAENVLVLKDESVRIIDFENGSTNADIDQIEAEKEEVDRMLERFISNLSCNGHG